MILHEGYLAFPKPRSHFLVEYSNTPTELMLHGTTLKNLDLKNFWKRKLFTEYLPCAQALAKCFTMVPHL